MAYQITLQPSGHSFEVAANETLLEAALDAGYILPYGCRNGACGSCRGKVLQGTVDHGKAQSGALPENARNEGHIIRCAAPRRSRTLP